jgi:hypothetical protein
MKQLCTWLPALHVTHIKVINFLQWLALLQA